MRKSSKHSTKFLVITKHNHSQHHNLIIDFENVNVVAERSIKKLESYCITRFKFIFNAKRFPSFLKYCDDNVIIPMKSELAYCYWIADFSTKNQVGKVILPKVLLKISIKDLNMVDNRHIYS